MEQSPWCANTKRHSRFIIRLTLSGGTMGIEFAGVLGIGNSRLLVHGAARTRTTVPNMATQRSPHYLLDDWFLQPSGFPHCYETGILKCALQWHPVMNSHYINHWFVSVVKLKITDFKICYVKFRSAIGHENILFSVELHICTKFCHNGLQEKWPSSSVNRTVLQKNGHVYISSHLFC